MNLGGIFKAALPFALAAFTGGASLAFAAQQSLMQTMGQQIVGMLAKQLGVPSGLAMQMFNGLTGASGGMMSLNSALDGVARSFGLSPKQAGDFGREMRSVMDDILKGAYEGGKKDGGSTSEGKESFLVAFAKAMGKAMDAKMDKMMEISKKIDTETKAANASDKDNKQQAVIGELSAEMQGLSQELNLLSQALSTSVKAAGEAMSTVARKG